MRQGKFLFVLLSLALCLVLGSYLGAAPGYGLENIAQNRPIQSLTPATLGALDHVNDNDLLTYWYSMAVGVEGSPGTYSCGFILDLGELPEGKAFRIGKIDIYASQTQGLQIETSLDGENWTLRHFRDDFQVEGPINLDVGGSYEARFLRYLGWTRSSQYVGVWEFAVFEWMEEAPPEPVGVIGTQNIALESQVSPTTFTTPFLIDGDITTAWEQCSQGSICWEELVMDLGEVYEIGRIVIRPLAIHMSVVLIAEQEIPDSSSSRVSPDGTRWQMYGYDELSSAVIDVNWNGRAKGRYLYLQFATLGQRSDFDSVSVAEVEVYEWNPDVSPPVNDTDGDGVPDDQDGCPTDSAKTAAGSCGCGVADVDTDGDFTMDCNDQCSNDPEKVYPWICPCGVADTDTDGDGTADCIDACMDDAGKVEPGNCGCGVSDDDADSDGVIDCFDTCLGTTAGDAVDGAGCSVDQRVPCGGNWKNHGDYVSSVAQTAEAFLLAGLITEAEKDQIVSEAARSSCGHKPKKQ